MEASYRKGSLMTISFNHTIIAAKDRQESAWFFTHMFGLPGPVEAGYFLGVELEHGVTLDFAQVEEGAEVASQQRLSTMLSSSPRMTSTASTSGYRR